MDRIDSAFGRLASAWEPGARLSPTLPAELPARILRTPVNDDSFWSRVPKRAVELRPSAAVSISPVLVVRHLVRAPTVFDCGMLASAGCEDRVYRIDTLAVIGFDELEQRCRMQAPRVLVIDIGLIRDAAALQRLRRRMPATDIVVAWHLAPATLDMPLLAQACGCIDWDLSPEQLTHALDAVMAGELWFPRAVLQSLYLSLRHAEAPVEPTIVSSDPAAENLTARETDVLALMRHGMTNKQIAERLDISVNTVKKHLGHVFEKLALHGRRQERSL